MTIDRAIELLQKVKDADVAGDMNLLARLKEEYQKALEPPYHLLVTGDDVREAYDAEGRRINERTGLRLPGRPPKTNADV
jgi:hypothetical protein